jgi:hypothetical protein
MAVRRCVAGALLSGSVLAACAAKTPVVQDDLAELAPGQFRYVVTATMLHPLNSNEGEHERLVRLKRRLAEKKLCPDGFRIVSRTPPMAFGTTHQGEYVVRDVTYLGECTG